MPATTLDQLRTPCLVLDAERMHHNIAVLRAQLQRLGAPLRAHVKTCKSLPVLLAMTGGERAPVTVSTLAEAEACFAHGFRDVLYAVGLAPNKLDAVQSLRARGCDLIVTVDSIDAARHVAARQLRIPAVIEIDSDGHRAGVRADAEALEPIANALARGGELRGVMTHAGASYECRGEAALVAMAERERAAVVAAADRLRRAGHACPIVSVGSTPTARFAQQLDGVTEVRAGVFVFADLVMAGLGVFGIDDVALSVLVSVIGHRDAPPRLLTDGGWMALSRDRGTADHAVDQHYGLVLDLDGRPCADLVVVGTNQEHGIIARRDGAPFDLARYPIGTLLRVLPNHACATAAQHDRYHVVRQQRRIEAVWPRWSGW
jgi:D-serine deaminase-like pyridoxal phosphate-dependent protein